MSEENVEIVRQLYDATNAFVRGEMTEEAAAQVAERFVDPHFEYDWPLEREIPDEPQHLRGVPAFIEYAEQLRSAWVDLTFEPLEFIEAPGGRVITPTRQSGRGRESGVPIEIHFFHVLTIRDGRVHKVELFRHRADALEAAGLSE